MSRGWGTECWGSLRGEGHSAALIGLLLVHLLLQVSAVVLLGKQNITEAGDSLQPTEHFLVDIT